MSSIYDLIANTYDNWYDTAEGHPIFHEELECLRLLCSKIVRAVAGYWSWHRSFFRRPWGVLSESIEPWPARI